MDINGYQYFIMDTNIYQQPARLPQEEVYAPIVPVQLRQMPAKVKQKRILVHEATTVGWVTNYSTNLNYQAICG